MRSEFLTAVSVQIGLSFWYVTLLTMQGSSYKNIFFAYILKHFRQAYTEFVWRYWRDRLGEPSVDGRIILRWISRKWDEGYGLDRSGSR
jgi:hypothetical protein